MDDRRTGGQPEPWRCGGLRWAPEGPGWSWWQPGAPGGGGSPGGGARQGGRLVLGERVALAVPQGAERRCAGVWRAGRRLPCPQGELIAPEARREQCAGCAALDRTQSVAADTVPDDPRPYTVYLAWFAPGLTKIGITAAERGPRRLLEQGAVCFTRLGEGPLMSARRAESVLGAALGIPDRVHAPRKRAGRLRLPPREERLRELRAVHTAAHRVPGWRDTLRPAPCAPVDHAALFGLEPRPPRPTAEVTSLPPGCAIRGVLLAAAGGDLYLATGQGELLLDSRLAAGWPLIRPDPADSADPAGPAGRLPPTTAPPPSAPPPESLF
ncbi:DUF2797 domain-containing protein [Streptomyces polyrhachis]|uniref:DUF2797 domain-containing protein n=1 Tax=Streptomyces polyrhachis TaxID=1282885 RepID=A0ABW2GFV2_9ACTN